MEDKVELDYDTSVYYREDNQELKIILVVQVETKLIINSNNI